MTESIRFVQHNLNRQRTASLQLRDYCALSAIDIVLVQEPVTHDGKIYGFENCRQVLVGDQAGAAVIILSKDIQAIELANMSSQHVAVVKISRGNHGGVGIL